MGEVEAAASSSILTGCACSTRGAVGHGQVSSSLTPPSLLLLAKEELIVLLCLEESLLEVVGVYVALAMMPMKSQADRHDLLSLLAKRMASV